jgi:hypothetical protein
MIGEHLSLLREGINEVNAVDRDQVAVQFYVGGLVELFGRPTT